MRVLVTGATGFIGRHLCRAMLDRNHTVVALARTYGASVRGVDTCVIGDCSTAPIPPDVFYGADAVIHLAARVHVTKELSPAPLDDYRRVNVRGTQNVACAAERAGVQRFIYLSSTKAIGETSDEVPFSEQTRPEPTDPYGMSKWEAENVLGSIRSLHTTILRPPMVYGPGVRANFLRLMKAIDRGIPLPLGAVRNRRSMIFVRNLVDAICAATEGAASGTFLVNDGESVSTPDLIRMLASAMGKHARLLRIPPSILIVGARIVGKNDVMDRLIRSLEIDDSSFRHTFQWKPPFSMNEGMHETVAWFRNRQERCS